MRLRPLAASDQDEFTALARASAALHHPWYAMPATREGAWRDHERWAITREMTGLPPVSPHPTQPAR